MLKRWILAGALLALGAGSAQADIVITGAGPRIGFSVSPDQLVVGGHAVIGEVAPSITFDPSLEIGFGDSQTTVGLNFDLHYHFVIRETDWRPYAGAGIGVNFVDVDNPSPIPDDSRTGVGGALILGAGVPTRSGNRFFGELKFGLGDEMASLKFMVGWNFRI